MNDVKEYKKSKLSLHKRHIQVPYSIAYQPNFSGIAKLIFMYLQPLIAMNGSCWMSTDKLIQYTGFSRPTIFKGLKELETKNVIIRAGHSYNRRFTFGSYFDTEPNFSETNSSQTSVQESPTSATHAPAQKSHTSITNLTTHNATHHVSIDLYAFDYPELNSDLEHDYFLEFTQTELLEQKPNTSITKETTPQEIQSYKNTTPVQPERLRSTKSCIYNIDIEYINNKQQQTFHSRSPIEEKPRTQTVVVFSVNQDKELLLLKQNLPTHKQPDLEDHDFLKAAKQHMDDFQQAKNCTLLNAYNAFKKLFITGNWVPPGEFQTKTQRAHQEAEMKARDERLRLQDEASKAKALEDMKTYELKMALPENADQRKRNGAASSALLDSLLGKHNRLQSETTIEQPMPPFEQPKEPIAKAPISKTIRNYDNLKHVSDFMRNYGGL